MNATTICLIFRVVLNALLPLALFISFLAKSSSQISTALSLRCTLVSFRLHLGLAMLELTNTKEEYLVLECSVNKCARLTLLKQIENFV